MQLERTEAYRLLLVRIVVVSISIIARPVIYKRLIW